MQMFLVITNEAHPATIKIEFLPVVYHTDVLFLRCATWEFSPYCHDNLPPAEKCHSSSFFCSLISCFDQYRANVSLPSLKKNCECFGLLYFQQLHGRLDHHVMPTLSTAVSPLVRIIARSQAAQLMQPNEPPAHPPNPRFLIFPFLSRLQRPLSP